jgi:hypothetical protein
LFTQQDGSKKPIRAKRIILMMAGIAVFAGGMIYVLCRTSDFPFFSWIRRLGFDDELTFLRAHLLPYGRLLPEWVVFSLPDGLWSLALTLIMLTIWMDSHSILKYVWYATIPILVFGYELLQWTGIVSGTFCFNDIILVAAGLLAGMVLAILIFKKSNYEIPNEVQHLI